MSGSFSNAKQTLCMPPESHPHPSGLEAEVCEILKLRQKAGDIRNLKWQHSLLLDYGVKWKVDWSFEQYVTDGGDQLYWQLRFAEAKGRSDRGYALKLRMFKNGCGPGPLELWKQGRRGPEMVKLIIPKIKEKCECLSLNSV